MKLLILLAIVVAGAAYYATHCCQDKQADLFLYPETRIWGRSKPDTNITPFTVKTDPKDIEDLKRRIAGWRRHDPIPGVGSTYGFAGQNLDGLVKYWREKYDFTKFDSRLNSLPQFTAVIQGLKVHFIHVKGDPKATKRVPLLMVHGWPGSIVEFYKAIPLLTSVGPDGTTFDVVVPSIPGFGFSEAPSTTGFSPLAAAQVLHSLMHRLGYEKFVYQGGDWGAMIGGLLSRVYPDSVIGYHSNFMQTPTNTLCDKLYFAAAKIAPSLLLDEQDAAKLAKGSLTELLEQTGFFHEQGTKPDTLGVGLTDSPVGFLAWIAEKFESASERAELKGDKEGISNDDLITNAMVYWLTNHVTSSVRLYKEFFQAYSHISTWSSQKLIVPTGVACYPAETACAPIGLLKHAVPRLVHHADIAHGGHFAAMEEPKLFADDVRAGVAAFLKAREEETATKKQ